MDFSTSTCSPRLVRLVGCYPRKRLTGLVWTEVLNSVRADCCLGRFLRYPWGFWLTTGKPGSCWETFSFLKGLSAWRVGDFMDMICFQDAPHKSLFWNVFGDIPLNNVRACVATYHPTWISIVVWSMVKKKTEAFQKLVKKFHSWYNYTIITSYQVDIAFLAQFLLLNMKSSLFSYEIHMKFMNPTIVFVFKGTNQYWTPPSSLRCAQVSSTSPPSWKSTASWPPSGSARSELRRSAPPVELGRKKRWPRRKRKVGGWKLLVFQSFGWWIYLWICTINI